MRKVVLFAVMIGVCTPVAVEAKKEPHPAGLELQQIQSRDFDVPKGVAFSAVMSVLQDDGYRITAAEKETGLITAIASTQSHLTFMPFVGFGRKKRTPVVSAYIEERGSNGSRIRLNFVMSRSSSNHYGGNEDEEPITDADVYTDAFDKIGKAVFVRQAMDAPAPAASAPAVSTAGAQAPAPGANPATSAPTPATPH